MGMHQANEFITTIQSRYTSIYTKLSELYNSFEEGMREVERIATIIEKEYDVRKVLVVDDLDYFMTSLNVDMENQIPTFMIRFVIEEGAWIVILRRDMNEFCNTMLKKLKTMEEQIWISQKAEPEDGVFYLLELKSIAEENIIPFLEYFRTDHGISSVNKFLPYFVATIASSFEKRGTEIVKGALRLLNKKLNDILPDSKIVFNTQWFTDAKEFGNQLQSEIAILEDSGYEISFMTLLLQAVVYLVSALQFQIRGGKADQNIGYTSPQVKKVRELISGFSDFSTDAIFGEFKEKVSLALLLYENIDPIDAALEIIKIYKSGISYRDLGNIEDRIRQDVQLKKNEMVNTQMPLELVKAQIVRDALPAILRELSEQEMRDPSD